MMTSWIIFGVFMLISWAVGARLRSKFRKFSLIPVNYGITGKEVAEKMLRENGISDVKVTCVEGELTDHYNPLDKTVNLSSDVYYNSNVAAVAVAAHECGHAVQHANAYSFLALRSKLVPVVGFASNWVQWILIAGVLFISSYPWILLIGIILFSITTLFSFITLPVEIDASQRALAWLNGAGITRFETHDKAQNALKWAAYTYIIAALASLAVLINYVLMYMGVSRDD